MVKINKITFYIFLVKILFRLLCLKNVFAYVNIYNTDVINFNIMYNQ